MPRRSEARKALAVKAYRKLYGSLQEEALACIGHLVTATLAAEYAQQLPPHTDASVPSAVAARAYDVQQRTLRLLRGMVRDKDRHHRR